MLPFIPTPADREQARLQARQRARELAVSMGLRPAEPAGKLANEQEEGCAPVAADHPPLMGMPVVWSLRELNKFTYNGVSFIAPTGAITAVTFVANEPAASPGEPPAPSGPSPMTAMPEWLDKGESINLARYYSFKNGAIPPATEEADEIADNVDHGGTAGACAVTPSELRAPCALTPWLSEEEELERLRKLPLSTAGATLTYNGVSFVPAGTITAVTFEPGLLAKLKAEGSPFVVLAAR